MSEVVDREGVRACGCGGAGALYGLCHLSCGEERGVVIQGVGSLDVPDEFPGSLVLSSLRDGGELTAEGVCYVSMGCGLVLREGDWLVWRGVGGFA